MLRRFHCLASFLTLAFLLHFASAPATTLAQDAEVGGQRKAETQSDQQLWYGVLDAKTQMFRFLVTTEDKDSGMEGTLLSVDEGMRKFELSELTVDGRQVRFALSVTKAAYEGQLSSDGTSVDGKWLQSGHEFELDFRKVDELPQEKLSAYWTGKLDALLQKLEVAFRELEDGTVLFDSLSQKVGGFVATKQVDGNKVTLEVPALAAKFTGELSDDGQEIVGRWKQGLIPLSLTLTKSEPAELQYAAPSRPQTPRPPFPYASEQVVVENPQAAGVRLAGTLTIPPGNGPFPAVVLISGSGPQDRDETIVDHKPFWVIADYLTRQGLAVLRFDDRGVAKSTGDFATATSNDFASDVAALVAFLREHEKLDGSKIALCGHSEGGLIAPMVAAVDPDIAAIVLLAGTGVNGEQILLSQARLIMQASGVPEVQVAKQAEMQQLMIDLAKQQPPLEKESFVAAARDALKDQLAGQELTKEQAEQMIAQAAVQLTTPWFRNFLTYEPAEALSRVSCPTLVLNGELDLQVAPSLNVPAIEAIFQKSGFTDFEVQILPKLNHLFQTAETGNVTEYSEIEETFSPVALQAMGDWLKKRLLDGRE